MKKAFSLIELSIVILIIGILIAGVTQSSRLISQMRLSSARALTQSSPVLSIKDLGLWYEATGEKSFSNSNNNYDLSDGDAVQNWYDQNAQASFKNNAVQATGANQPNYIASGMNGLPVVRFNTTNSTFMTFDGAFLIGTNYTIFLVEQRRSATGGIISGTGGANQNLHIIYATGTIMRISHYAADLDYSSIPNYSTPVPRMHSFTMSSTLGKSYWLNGGTTADATAAQYGQLTAYPGSALGRLGNASTYFNVDIAEVIIFTRNLKTEERNSIETYLSKKWGITIS